MATSTRRAQPAWLTAAAANTATGSGTNAVPAWPGGVRDPSGKTSEYYSMEDECPVCKSDRYLNPKLRLLVSPCYHKMCESCIDRLFTLGPQGCPVCKTVLRKMQFTVQTFEDLTVEKEVAVRRRITKEFNKRPADFPDLRSYNDYLEDVEDITFNLINNIDVPQTEARIAEFRQANAALIEMNIQREERDLAGLRAEEERVKREREERLEEAKLMEEEERAERAREKMEIIEGLQSGSGSVDAIIARSRATARAQAERRHLLKPITSASSTTLTFQRPRTERKDAPHVPFADHYYCHQDKFVVREQYSDPGTDGVLRSIGLDVMRAGGYDISEVWERAIRTSVVGLDVPPLELQLDV